MLPGRVQLLDHDDTFAMAGIGNHLEWRNDRVIAVAHIAAGEHGGAVDGNGLDHNHRRTAFGPFQVIPQMPGSGQTVHRHIGRMRSKNDAIFKRFVAQCQRRKQRIH